LNFFLNGFKDAQIFQRLADQLDKRFCLP